ncbi:HAMP domain-containing sensor histidine kinase [Massilibacteroides sp.]|uniref:sensor histidine kinase n=1 Tax=Massilibacteroides sp. TaxID=2034766 RepID=UPI002608A6C8|nr:HAMP domain-containing sensor histidine kinase [Massilibacteroides sp.]MDD4516290.1 HAMP domain-containing sensor histidine kinase [Massilibacteroides sp.]
MNSIYDYRQRLKFFFVLVAVLIAIASVVVSDLLIKDFAQEERQKIEVWAEATRVMTSENPSLNMSFVLKIIMGNTSIPVVLCDEAGYVIENRNIDVPEKDVDEFWQEKVKELRAKNPPIEIDLGDGTYHYVYYDDSLILKSLVIYPYAQLTIVFIFIVIAFLALANLKRAEQNKVWVGLSKETAHQLGTPISSLIAWVEYFKTKDIDPSLLTEMEKDVKRLETIAERFSKIGSNPELLPIDINESLRQALAYMGSRISSKVKIVPHYTEEPLFTSMNESLFAWVVENLLKNAVDAMEGQGEVDFYIEDRGKRIRIEISDTGKGIHKSKFKTVFTPGYTTKERGWGLGLSLVKRIVESYHKGKIYVKSSELGKGTVFCLELRKYKK